MQHSDSYSLPQQDVHGDSDDVENCEQELHDISGKKKRARAEERIFDGVDRWDRSDTKILPERKS